MDDIRSLTRRLTPEDYRELVEKQGGRCAICRCVPKAGRALCIDHDHKTTWKRGIICDPCNLALGMLRDDPVRCLRLARYLLAPPLVKMSMEHLDARAHVADAVDEVIRLYEAWEEDYVLRYRGKWEGEEQRVVPHRELVSKCEWAETDDWEDPNPQCENGATFDIILGWDNITWHVYYCSACHLYIATIYGRAHRWNRAWIGRSREERGYA